VRSFSLLSNATTADEDVRAMPLFDEGVVTHPCTRAVTSTHTNASACTTETVCEAVPSAGSVL